MKRIVHTLCFHGLYQQPDGLDHDYRIGGFDGYNDIRKVFIPTDSQELHARFDHPMRCITIPAHDPVRQRTVVYSNTNRRMMFLAYLEKRHEAVAYFLQFGRIFLVRIFLVAEGLYLIHIVSRIDTYFLYLDSCCICSFRVEMNIGYQWSGISLFIQLTANNTQVVRFTFALCCETDIFGSGFDHPDGLLYGSFRIHGGNIGHRLDTNRIVTSHRCIPDLDYRRLTTFVIEIIHVFLIR